MPVQNPHHNAAPATRADTRRARLALLGFFALLGVAGGFPPSDATGAPTRDARPACPTYEDDRNWRWSACGNTARGLKRTDGAFVVVGRCEFARLAVARRIDWNAPYGRLHGDRYALRWAAAHGCVTEHASIPAMRKR